MNSHTPGPWRVGRAGNECRIYSPADEHAIARTYGLNLNGIGVCELTGPKNKADAELIAAAPEMKDALDAFLRAIYLTPEAELHTAILKAASLASAAMRKAGGLDPALWSCIKK